jgi:hypothetical protein
VDLLRITLGEHFAFTGRPPAGEAGSRTNRRVLTFLLLVFGDCSKRRILEATREGVDILLDSRLHNLQLRALLTCACRKKSLQASPRDFILRSGRSGEQEAITVHTDISGAIGDRVLGAQPESPWSNRGKGGTIW